MPRLKGNKKTKKALTETQTLRASCSKAEPKNFISPHHRPPSRGRGTARIQSAGDGHTFTYKPSLV